MAKNKNRQREFVADKIPLVSVIIPMYNSAKFIPQTLESLLYQTMKNFEVIVVDDCSTDNSVEVVESFAPKFAVWGGVLHIIKLPKNTGTPGLPRNVGIQMACGKYIAFLDSDDLFTKTALEELTTLAKKYQADIVHTNQFFALWNGKRKPVDDLAFTDMNELTNPANFIVYYYSRSRSNEPIFETNDTAKRVRKFLANDYTRESCVTFYRRDFLISKQIFFANIRIHEDEPFAFQGMCLAEKILLVPNIFHIVRRRENSITRKGIDITVKLHRDLRSMIDGFNELKKIMDDIEFFSQHTDYRYYVLDWYTQSKLNYFLNAYANISPDVLNEFVEREFHSQDVAFSAYLFNTVNIYRLHILKLQQELNALKNHK